MLNYRVCLKLNIKTKTRQIIYLKYSNADKYPRGLYSDAFYFLGMRSLKIPLISKEIFNQHK